MQLILFFAVTFTAYDAYNRKLLTNKPNSAISD